MTITRVHALIPAAGSGERLGGVLPKQYLSLAGKPVIVHVLETLAEHPMVSGITVVLASDDHWFDDLRFSVSTHVDRVTGGATRAASVMNGLTYIAERHQVEWVMVHDAARPCLTHENIDRLLEEGSVCEDGAILAIPVRDTLKRQDADGRIDHTLERAGAWAAQTPQLFPLEALSNAIQLQMQAGQSPTDEAAAMEATGARPKLVQGSAANIKITWPEDVQIASSWLRAEQARS